MKRKEILVLIGEVLGSRAVYSVASLVITITMLSGITIILRNDIRDIKNYVQSVVDGDPNYKEIHSQVTGSENVIRGNIDLETLLAKEDKKAETTSTANNVSSGYDNYTPTQTIADDYNNKPSNGLNTSNNGETTIANNNNNNSNNNNSNSNSNNSTNEVNNNNNNSDEDKKEDVLDRSSFNGKDVMVSEGEPFNPMNALQLAATDINGKNITNKIVITENNVDTYKPGLYTVKANVTLSNENTLEKEFLVRVEPTILNLAVNDLKISKDVLEKNEHFNLTFAVKSSKSYLEVSSVNINNKDYSVKQISSNSFFRTSNKYEVDLVAPSKGGTEKIEIKSVTMSDGTIVDINKSVNIEILKEEAQLTDASIKNISNENENIFLEYKLEDVDDTINKAFLYLYDENDIIIQQEELEKNNKSYINLNINENGKYKVQIKAYYKEDISIIPYSYNEKELFLENLEIDKFNRNNFEQGHENEVDILSMNYDEINVSSNDEVISVQQKSNIIGNDENEQQHDIKIIGNVMDSKGNLPVGVFKVTVPTKANFTVTKDGVVLGSELQVENSGSQKIEVYAYKFIDESGSEKINIIDEQTITNGYNKINNTNLSLKLTGMNGDGTAYLSSNNMNNGIYKDKELSSAADEMGIKILTLEGGTEELPSSGKIKIEGKSGKKAILEPVSDKFKLTLKIKKATN